MFINTLTENNVAIQKLVNKISNPCIAKLKLVEA